MGWYRKWVIPFLPMGIVAVKEALETADPEAKKHYMKAAAAIVKASGPIAMIYADDPDFAVEMEKP